jgi:hypothetical protein
VQARILVTRYTRNIRNAFEASNAGAAIELESIPEILMLIGMIGFYFTLGLVSYSQQSQIK